MSLAPLRAVLSPSAAVPSASLNQDRVALVPVRGDRLAELAAHTDIEEIYLIVSGVSRVYGDIEGACEHARKSEAQRTASPNRSYGGEGVTHRLFALAGARADLLEQSSPLPPLAGTSGMGDAGIEPATSAV
jgi:hypothetical protein